MLIRFNNNNIWEIVDEVVFYKRVPTKQALSTLTIDKEINEDELVSSKRVKTSTIMIGKHSTVRKC